MSTTTESRRTIFAWTLFDFANTGFYVIIITLVFPIYFKNVIAGGNEAYWGRLISTSMLLTAALGPLLGSIADATGRKKLFLGIFTGACVAATAGLWLTGAGTLLLAALLLIVANVGFEGGTVFYDAFLPEITTESRFGKVSGYGFAMGYLGSFAILMIVLPILSADHVPEENVRATFLIAAAFFAVFSLPIFFVLREQGKTGPIPRDAWTAGYRRLRETFTHIRQYDSIRRFLLAFFIYNDSILTVILFAGIFADKTLGLSTKELIYFFMIVQGSALAGSLIFGAITNRLGARQVIVITLLIWIGIVAAAYFITTRDAFFILGAVAGLALGSSQSTSRTMMALLTPFEKRTEFFGFYDGFFGKASAVIGPVVFGEVSRSLGQRPAMLVLGVIFIVGILLVLRVPDVRPALVPVDLPVDRETLDQESLDQESLSRS
jgi:UMF1 family MFS transporter